MDTLVQWTFLTSTHTHMCEQIIFIEVAIAVFTTYTYAHKMNIAF